MAAGDATGVVMGIGDDTAVLEPTPRARLLATTDLLIEGVHFRRAWATPFDIGWKAMAVNLSDIAAKGGRPRWALVGLALPTPANPADVAALYDGMREAATPHGVIVVGPRLIQVNFATPMGVSNVCRPSDHRLISQPPIRASIVLPNPMAQDV